MRWTGVTVDIAITPCTATHRLRLPVEFQNAYSGDVAAALRRGGAWLDGAVCGCVRRPGLGILNQNLGFKV